MRILVPVFVVWDKTAHIRFRRPGKSKLFVVLKISQEDLSSIRSQVKESGHASKTFSIKWWYMDQMVYAEIERQCYIADKGYYETRKDDSRSAKF